MTTPSQVIIDDNFRLLLNLLEKSEQILSVINLSDSAVSKYNQLKQLTFQQLNLPFNPLVKCIPHQINHTHQNPPTNNNANILLTKSFLLQNIKALMLIETIINYISNQQKEEFYLEHLDSIFNLGMNTVINKTQEELEVELKTQGEKLKVLFCSFDQFLRNKSNLLKEVAINYEHKIEEMKTFYDKEIMTLKEQVNKFTIIEQDLFNVRKQYDMHTYLLEKISQLIGSSYDKYFPKNHSWYKSEHYENEIENNPMLEQIRFLMCLIDKYYTDNKYLSDLVPSLQQEKLELNTNMNMPFVKNVIANNDLMKELYSDVDNVKKSYDTFHNNFEELINYISTNVEGKIM
jgi:hypothetical protein